MLKFKRRSSGNPYFSGIFRVSFLLKIEEKKKTFYVDFDLFLCGKFVSVPKDGVVYHCNFGYPLVRDTLSDFLIWKMLGESEYVIGLEPRTTSYGGQNIIDHKKYVRLEPFCEYKTRLKFEVKESSIIKHCR